nr:hypothetical protein [Candidatus Krumholzibacteria bacterium]
MKSSRMLLASVLCLALLGLTACSDSTVPETPAGNVGVVQIEGSLDPGAGTFVLKTLDLTNPDGPPVRVQLVGSGLVTDPELETVDLMVALRSLHYAPLYAPATIWLDQFQPGSVSVLNADFLYPWGIPGGPEVFGFDYSELLGDDQILSPEETSEAKLWRFHSPGLGAFSFGAHGEFGLNPGMGQLGGLCFQDENRNGVHDADEGTLGHGVVRVVAPDGEVTEVLVRPDGQWTAEASAPGLYEVSYDPMIDTFVPIAFSTPNPRQVILTEGPDGQLHSFLDANFGMYTDVPPGWPVIQFTEEPADSLHYDIWDLQEAEIQGHWLLELEVGYTGCNPNHPFSLWMTGGFMESNPVQVNLVPVHDLMDDCDAYWSTTRTFNMWPLRERFLDAYGPGVLILNVLDFQGEVTRLEWEIYPED